MLPDSEAGGVNEMLVAMVDTLTCIYVSILLHYLSYSTKCAVCTCASARGSHLASRARGRAPASRR